MRLFRTRSGKLLKMREISVGIYYLAADKTDIFVAGRTDKMEETLAGKIFRYRNILLIITYNENRHGGIAIKII